MRRFVIIILMALGFVVLSPVAAQAQTAPGTYAALGDSVAAGAGLSGEGTICDRSTEAYPHIVAQQTGLALEQYACAGAKVDEGIYDSQERDGTSFPAQLDQAFSTGTPSLITMTVGANDARWAQFIQQCYYLRCGYGVDTARFEAYLLDLKLELDTAMTKIRTLSDGELPQVIVTGYYDPFSSSESCSDTTDLISNEISWLERRIDDLNDAIRDTVEDYSYAEYASVSFSGHELCSEDSWIQGQSDAMPFHPTADGQREIAEAVLDEYSAESSVETASSEGSYSELSESEVETETEVDADTETQADTSTSQLERLRDWCRRMRE